MPSPEKDMEARTDKFRKRVAKAIEDGIDVLPIVQVELEKQQLVAPAAMTRAEKDVKAWESAGTPFDLSDVEEL